MFDRERRSPPIAVHRRYPSLSDDGLLWFPRSTNDTTSDSPRATRLSHPDEAANISYVRVIAIGGMVAILAALVASA